MTFCHQTENMATGAPSAEKNSCETCTSFGATDVLSKVSVIQLAASLEKRLQLALCHADDLHAKQATLSEEINTLRAVVAEQDRHIERDLMLCEDFRSQLLRSRGHVATVDQTIATQASYITALEDAVLHQETRIRIINARNEQLRIERVDTQIDRDALMDLLLRHSARYRRHQVINTHAATTPNETEPPRDVLEALQVTMDIVSAVMTTSVAEPPVVVTQIPEAESKIKQRTLKSNSKKTSPVVETHATTTIGESESESSQGQLTTELSDESTAPRNRKRRSAVIETTPTKLRRTHAATKAEPETIMALVPFGQHTEDSFHQAVAALLREFNHSRYWASLVFAHRVISATTKLPSKVALRDPMNALQPHRLHIFPLSNEVVANEVPRQVSERSYPALQRLITEVEDAKPWETMIGLWPNPVMFNHHDERFHPLYEAMKAWVRDGGARLLFYRTHNFRYSAYIPDTPPTSESERALKDRAMALDKRNNNSWSRRIVNSRGLLQAILHSLATGLVDVRIFLEPALLLLPSDNMVYRWSPDVRCGSPSISTQLAAIDSADPWRVLYVHDVSHHPLYRYNYFNWIGDVFPDFIRTPGVRLPFVTPPGEIELPQAIKELLVGVRGKRRTSITSLMNDIDND
jgi:hypothetical protein